MKGIVERLKRTVPVTRETFQRDDLAFITTDSDHCVSAVTHLRDQEGFTHLVLLTAVDWLEDGLFQLTYLLNNPLHKIDIGLRITIPREAPEAKSIHHLWPAAATYQRELYEMFGIRFPGSPRMEEPFILDEGWDGPPPYRRDFDTLKYAEETYFPRPGRTTKDPAKHMQEKLYPEARNV